MTETLNLLFSPAEGTGEVLHRALYAALREAILSGRLEAGSRLPATRSLAAQYGLSRNTVLTAYQDLSAEGFLESRVGDGTYVAPGLGRAATSLRAEGSWRLSLRGEVLASTPVTVGRERKRGAFRHGLPALEAFPFALWARLEARHWRNPDRSLLGYADPAGFAPLREAIAAHLRASRAVNASPDQVVIVSGSQGALDLVARLLLDPGEAAWVEDPGYIGARGALTAAGARLVPVPVDEAGLEVSRAERLEPAARLAYVTPSHQYPTAVTMSLERRAALLDWARRSDAWIIEDDYDAEYRHSGRPLESLQGLDRDGRVIYIGTFSKVMFPGLRLGYAVVPPDLSRAFVNARALQDRAPPGVVQAALNDFLREGHFARHLARTRKLYRERRDALVEAAVALGGRLELRGLEAGMHCVGLLPPGTDDALVSSRAAALGLETLPLSAYALSPLERGGLLLGYAACTPQELRDGIGLLARALDE